MAPPGEAAAFCRIVGGLSPPQLAALFAKFNRGVLESFLIEITAQIYLQPDERVAGGALVDAILDSTGSKGTGKWTIQQAAELGVRAGGEGRLPRQRTAPSSPPLDRLNAWGSSSTPPRPPPQPAPETALFALSSPRRPVRHHLRGARGTLHERAQAAARAGGRARRRRRGRRGVGRRVHGVQGAKASVFRVGGLPGGRPLLRQALLVRARHGAAAGRLQLAQLAAPPRRPRHHLVRSPPDLADLATIWRAPRRFPSARALGPRHSS